MTKKHLSIFIEVCKQNSITLASQSLNMTQPAVSLAIKELESYYHMQLFDRMNRTIYLTEAGSSLLQYATHIIELFKEADSLFQCEDIYKHLRIGANVSYGASELVSLLVQFTEQYPQIQLSSVIDRSHVIEKMVLENRLDLAIVDDISAFDNITKIPIVKEEMICVCSPNYFKTLPSYLDVSQLAEEKLLLREKGSGSREIVEQTLFALGFHIHPVMESSDTQTLLKAAIYSLGIAVMQRSSIAAHLAAGNLVELHIKNLKFIRQYYLIYHKSKLLNPPMKQMMELLTNRNE